MTDFEELYSKLISKKVDIIEESTSSIGHYAGKMYSTFGMGYIHPFRQRRNGVETYSSMEIMPKLG